MIIFLAALFILFAIFASQSQELKNLIVTGVKVEKELNEMANSATISLHNMAVRSEMFVDSHQSFFSLVDNFVFALEEEHRESVDSAGEIDELKSFFKEMKALPRIFNSTISELIRFADQLENSDLLHSLTRTSNLTSTIEEKLLDLFLK